MFVVYFKLGCMLCVCIMCIYKLRCILVECMYKCVLLCIFVMCIFQIKCVHVLGING